MKISKRIAFGLLAIVLLLGMIPAAVLPAQAISFDLDSIASASQPTAEHYQYALMPVHYLYIARTNVKLDPEQDHSSNAKNSGHRAFAFDLNANNAPKSVEHPTWVYAPFDMKVIHTGGSNGVYVESLEPVRFANGTVDYMTCVFVHDNALNVKTGDIIKQGEHFYDMGTEGISTGTHVHIEVAAGKDYAKGVNLKEYYAYWKILQKMQLNGVHLHDAFFLESTTTIGKDYTTYGNKTIDLDWKTVQKVTLHSNTTGIGDTVRYLQTDGYVGQLPSPTATGKYFKGWYTAQTGGTKAGMLMKVTKKLTDLYAQWGTISNSTQKFTPTMKVQEKTATDATLSLSFNTPGIIKATRKYGVYIGTDPNYMIRLGSKSATLADLKKGIPFKLSTMGVKLQPNTTYYYRFYTTTVLSTTTSAEICSTVSSFTTNQAPTGGTPCYVEWAMDTPTNVSATSATLYGAIAYKSDRYGQTPVNANVEKYGLYLGTSKTKLKKTHVATTVNQKSTFTNFSYNLSEEGVSLTKGQKYYYQFYVVINGREYKSGVGNFTATTPKTPTKLKNLKWSNYGISGITKNSATISAKVTYGKQVTPERCGFYIGTTKDQLHIAANYDSINRSRTLSNMTFKINQYDLNLAANTKYYYQFYVVVNGVEYRSAVKEFTTAK